MSFKAELATDLKQQLVQKLVEEFNNTENNFSAQGKAPHNCCKCAELTARYKQNSRTI